MHKTFFSVFIFPDLDGSGLSLQLVSVRELNLKTTP